METDVIIIGAGAAGMMCAIEAGKRGRRVLLLEHNKKPGEKIRISGGGRCNFTNLNTTARNFISQNPHFVKSALAQFTAVDFIAMVDRHNIGWHEKTLGQLFCDNRSSDIINMLMDELDRADVEILTGCNITNVGFRDGKYLVNNDEQSFCADALVIATGGKSIPKMGASGFGYDIARQFGLAITDTRPALVPFTFDPKRLESFSSLVGTAFNCRASIGNISFEEAALFTHRGLSGPAMLQISSYWREGEEITIEFVEAAHHLENLNAAKQSSGKLHVHNWLADVLPKALGGYLVEHAKISGRLGDLNKQDINALRQLITDWRLRPAGSEGYRTAEVTLGGVDTNDLNSRTLEAKKQEGLYFIGEVVDVTGWLGGYNFQWAWSSGWVAGQNV